MKARILWGSFTPGALSTPEETSTPPAFVIASASATLPACSPPDSMKGIGSLRFSSRCQSNGLPRPPGRVATRVEQQAIGNAGVGRDRREIGAVFDRQHLHHR